MNASLDADIAAALDSAGLRARSFQRLSKLDSTQSQRVAYRIDLDSGHTIKARRLQDEASALRLFQIRQDLPKAFAAAFACRGAVLLEEWIEGELLGDRLPADAHLLEAGALLADLHARAMVGGQPVHGTRDTTSWLQATERYIQQIQADGGVEESHALRLRMALAESDPGHARVGLIHTDFCGENMVVDGEGRLRVIDNERLGIDALGFDLARTWYRWALPGVSWERVRGAYVAAMTTTEVVDTLGFWRIVAVAHSAALRLRMDRARAHVPIERLRQMARDLVQ